MPITVFSPDLLVLQLHASDLRRNAHQSLFNGSLDLVRGQPVIFLGQLVSYSLEKAWHIAKPCTPDCKKHPMSAGYGDLGGQNAWVIVWFSLPFLPKFDPYPSLEYFETEFGFSSCLYQTLSLQTMRNRHHHFT